MVRARIRFCDLNELAASAFMQVQKPSYQRESKQFTLNDSE